MKYPLIHINDFMYAVDEKAEKKYNDIGIYLKSLVRIYDIDKEAHHGCSFEYLKTKNAAATKIENVYKVVATNNPSLKLPLLPAVEEDKINQAHSVAVQALNEYPHSCSDSQCPACHEESKLRRAFAKGYKSASAKQFTEEDMRKCFQAAREFNSIDGPVDVDVVLSFSGADNSDLQAIWATPEDYIQSLKPKPVAVELEITRKCELKKDDCFGLAKMTPDCGCEWIPLVDKNNYVKIKQWYYE